MGEGAPYPARGGDRDSAGSARPRGCGRCCRTVSAHSRPSGTHIKLARVAPDDELAMDTLIAEAVLEFARDLRARTGPRPPGRMDISATGPRSTGEWTGERAMRCP
jgi:hypothetical protein